MKRSIGRVCALIAATAGAYVVHSEHQAIAVGLVYADPGWFHVLDGSTAYYHDPDGPNPNYTRTSGPDDGNAPGGAANEPALISVGVACEPNCEDIAIWQGSGTQWDGSKPGDPLGGVPGSPPPLPPAAPGGVGAFTEGSTNFIRLQDAGQPQNWGWADKGEQGFPGGPRQEGSNRRIQFKHEMNRDAAYSDVPDILDRGVTISFRTRIATPATGPIDALYPEGGTGSMAWPVDGIGYPVGNNGRGMFMVTQTGSTGPGQLAFGLVNMNTITANGLSITKTGLVLNNRASSPTGGSPDTGDATAQTLNIVEIEDALLDEWHEFWITIRKLPTTADGNTHEAKVYVDGMLTPQIFQLVLGNQNEFGTGSHLGIGLSSGSRLGAYDIDFYAYLEGVVEPMLANQALAGDYNDDGKVDAADYVLWRNGGPLANETLTIGSITSEDYAEWRAHFGATAASGAAQATDPVPETTSLMLALIAGCAAVGHQRRRGRVATALK